METNPDKARAMVRAIDNNDVTKLKILLEHTNQKNPIIIQNESIHNWSYRKDSHRMVLYDLTALQYSAIKGKLGIFKSVSDSLQDINPTGKNGRTSLHLAAMAGHLSIGKAIF